MDPSSEPTALQEDLDLHHFDRFQYSTDSDGLGLDRDTLARLVDAGPLCFLDFEATGLDVADDDLIEAGAVRIQAGDDRITVFNSLIHTPMNLTPFIKRLTGIGQLDVDGAPQVDEVAVTLDTFIADAAVVAHNAAFERGWLVRRVSPRFARHPFLDTVELLALVYPDSPNMKLDTFCQRHLRRRERHRALDDALDTLRIVVGIYDEARAGSPAATNAREALRSFNPSCGWLPRLEGLPASPASAADSTATVNRALSVAPPVALDEEAIAERLSDTEAGGTAIPGFEPRSGQEAMMRSAFDAFAGKGGRSVSLCEAGTGIGKTLAYLSVAIPFARATGEQVIISTSSKMLQTQLLEKDIPAAARLLGHQSLRYTVMKGRGNYVCRRRLDDFLSSHGPGGGVLNGVKSSGGFEASLLAAFANSANHGELDRIPSVLFRLNGSLERYCRDVSSADAGECSRNQCETTRTDCVFRNARRRLEGAEIAVVNHDLLLRWPPDYPPLRHLIVDEIHELVDKCDSAFARAAEGVELTRRLEALLAERRGKHTALDDRAADEAQRALTLVAALGQAARAVVGESDSFQFNRDELLIPADGPGAEWNDLTHAALELAAVLGSLSARLGQEGRAEKAAPGVDDILRQSAELIEAGLPVPKSDRFVFRLRGLSRRNSNSWRFIGTPVLPAEDFRARILDHVETFFGTSATLSTGSNPAASVRELNLEEGAGGRFHVAPTIISPFNYAENLDVVFVTDPTDPSRLVEKSARVITTVAHALNGRTLGLFTSRDRLAKVADLIDEPLKQESISIIAPAAATDPHELARSFLASERAVLLGARAFWQGVDLAGDACQAVVIEKLPFDVPGDPLLERRAQTLVGRRNQFHDYSLPRMLLRLKQMMGRLIRTPTDRGIIVVVESRSDKPYFHRLMEAVPEGARCHRTSIDELESVVAPFAQRLGH